jgi:hypothetical protein
MRAIAFENPTSNWMKFGPMNNNGERMNKVRRLMHYVADVGCLKSA